MVQGIDDSFIAPADRYTSEGAKNILLKLAEAGTPLPLLIQEVYAGRRLVFYSDEDNAVILYRRSIPFYSILAAILYFALRVRFV